jgi:hypothetical protein
MAHIRERDPYLTRNAGRLLRRDWPSADLLAQELYVILVGRLASRLAATPRGGGAATAGAGGDHHARDPESRGRRHGVGIIGLASATPAPAYPTRSIASAALAPSSSA